MTIYVGHWAICCTARPSRRVYVADFEFTACKQCATSVLTQAWRNLNLFYS